MTTLLRVCFALPLLLQQVEGFSNNLVVTTAGCLTELDTSEVIMNSFVKASEESEFPKMHLAVLEDDNHMESPYHYKDGELIVAFVNPYTHEEFPDDLEFVIQLQGEGAEFTAGGAIGCDGNQRVAAALRENDGQVTLQVHDMTGSYKLWAGWATSQVAVQLTTILELVPHVSKDAVPKDTPDDQKPVELREQVEEPNSDTKEKTPVEKGEQAAAGDNKGDTPTVQPNPGKRKGPKGNTDGDSEPVHVDIEQERKLAHIKNNQHDHKEKKMDDKPRKAKLHRLEGERDDRLKQGQEIMKRYMGLVDPADIIGDEEASHPPEAEELQSEDTPPAKSPSKYNEAERRKQLEAELEHNFPDQRSFRYRYEAGIDLQMSNFFYACAFFVFSMGSILVLLSKRREKGRRDL